MLDSFRKIYDLLDDRERRQLYGLTFLTMIMGMLEVLGVASILPFLALVSDPSAIETNVVASTLYELSGITERNAFLVLMGSLVFFFVLFTTLVRAGTFYALTYFTRMRMLSLATQLMERYLEQPYTWFLGRHSSDLGKTILSEVAQVVNGSISASLRLVAHSMMVLFLVVFLFLLKPMAAIGAAVLFGGCYGIIFMLARNSLTRMGEERVTANRERFQIMQEAMGGVKNVKLMGLESGYLDRFQKPTHRLARNQAALAIISEMPRHLLEVVAFGGMILFVLWLLLTQQGMVSEVVPILGVYAFAAARMFPTIQQLFASLSALRFGKSALDNLHSELTSPPPGDLTKGADLPPIPLRKELRLENVSFTFPGADGPALSDFDLTIPAHGTIGIVGETGAGKTTVVDMILGLLPPDIGRLTVDGVEVNDANVRGWQKSVGYVPQEIFLVDDTISANIAFGSPHDQIDHAAVERAARGARLHDFVTEQLPQGYDTSVGERGTRLSGGQRQRIGIARALYKNPDVLVFDEATSALDNVTEKAVLEAIQDMGREKTVIMIAHRLSTVRKCDRVVMLERGRLAATDTYEGLVASHAQFREMHEATA